MADTTPAFDPHDLLRAFLPRGLATVSHLTALLGLTSEQRARRLTEKHTSGPQPWFKATPLAELDRPGRPTIVYLLTDHGARELSHLCGKRVTPPAVADPVEIRHAVCEMTTFVAAARDGIACQVEHVVKYENGRNMRFDLLVHENQEDFVFEIEQAASVSSIGRILEKLENLECFFSADTSHDFSDCVRVLFNLGRNDQGTISVWQQTLRRFMESHPEPSFSLWYCWLDDFVSSPQWDCLDQFTVLKPAERAAMDSAGPSPKNHRLSSLREYVRHAEEHTSNTLSDDERDFVDIVSGVFFDRLSDIEHDARRSACCFFDLVDTMYHGSFGEHPEWRRSASLPWISLLRLRLYLDRPHQAELRKQLLEALKRVRGSRYQGFRMTQDTLTCLVWDTFLRFHGLARGGPLNIVVLEPDAMTWRTDFHLLVRFGMQDSNGYGTSHWPGVREGDAARYTEQALAWVMEVLWVYPTDLNLVEERTPKRGAKDHHESSIP